MKMNYISMIQSNLTYMVVDCVGMEYDTGMVYVIISLVISMVIVVPVVEKVAIKKDRRFACLTFLSATLVGLVICKIIGLDKTVGGFHIMAVVVAVLLGIGVGTFWTLFYSMSYDLVELDEFKSGERHEAIVTALPQLVQKFGSAFGILMAGQLLSLYGYDSSQDIAGKESLMVSIIALIFYPMTRKNVELLMSQLEKKRNGEKYSQSGLEKLL